MAEGKRLPAWLTAKVDQRLAEMREATGGPATFKGAGNLGMVMTPVTEPREGATDEEYERWDRTCDSCGKYVPAKEKFYTGHLVHDWEGVNVYLTYGVCHECKERDERD